MDYKVFTVRLRDRPGTTRRTARWSGLVPDFDVFTLRDVPLDKEDLLLFLTWACRGTGVLGMDIKEIKEGGE